MTAARFTGLRHRSAAEVVQGKGLGRSYLLTSSARVPFYVVWRRVWSSTRLSQPPKAHHYAKRDRLAKPSKLVPRSTPELAMQPTAELAASTGMNTFISDTAERVGHIGSSVGRAVAAVAVGVMFAFNANRPQPRGDPNAGVVTNPSVACGARWPVRSCAAAAASSQPGGFSAVRPR